MPWSNETYSTTSSWTGEATPAEAFANEVHPVASEWAKAGPRLTISSPTVSNGGSTFDVSISIIFTLTESTNDFGANDVIITGVGGTLSSFSKDSDLIYSATLTPGGLGLVKVIVPQGKFTNAAGGPNNESNEFQWTYQERFDSEWVVASDGDTIELPLLSSGGDYNMVVDWGDDSTTTITAYAHRSHTYTSAGTYRIKIDTNHAGGVFKGWKFAGGGSRLNLTKIHDWGHLQISTKQAFDGCNNLDVVAVNAPIIASSNLQMTFQNCWNLENIGKNWNLSATAHNASGVTNVGYMFTNCYKFNEDISNWNVGTVTNFSAMFYAARDFNRDIGQWDMSSAITIAQMFKTAEDFNQDISNWVTTNITSLYKTFDDATSFNNGGKPLVAGTAGKWNVSKVVTAYRAFRLATSFNQDIGNWNTEKLATATEMFLDASAFNQNLGDWDPGQFVNADNMFKGANAVSNENYNKTLVGWYNQEPGANIDFHGGDAIADTTSGGVNGLEARANLTLPASSNGFSWTIEDGLGMSNASLSLDGTNHCVTAPHDSTGYDLAAGGNPANDSYPMFDASHYTISMWIKPTDLPNTWRRYGLINKGHNLDAQQLYVYIGHSGQITLTHYGGGGGSLSTAAGAVTVGEWNHVFVRYHEGSKAAKIHINNVEKASGNLVSSLSNTDSKALFIGAGFNGSVGATYPDTYKGLIDDVAVWNIYLSDANKTAVYNSGKPNNLLSADSYDSDSSNFLKAYFKFEYNANDFSGHKDSDNNPFNGKNVYEPALAFSATVPTGG